MIDPESYVVKTYPPGAAGGDQTGSRSGNPGKPPRRRRRPLSGSDLMAKKFPPVKFVVPGYVPEGLTVFAGNPKVGKSWFCIDMAIAVATGGTCLGQPCVQGDVLYLALEDNERRIQDRIKKITPPLVAKLDLGRFNYSTVWDRADGGGVEDIASWIAEAPDPRLVIVDVLAKFRPAGGDRSGKYEADYAALEGLQSLASRTGVAIVAVTHTRKMEAETDPFETISGTMGISGAADSAIILATNRKTGGVTLYGRGRDVAEFEAAVLFDKPSFRWEVVGKPDDVYRSDERNEILGILKAADEPMTAREIKVLLGKTGIKDGNTIDARLMRMARDGEILKPKRGHYVHPDRADLMRQHAAGNSDTDSDRVSDNVVRFPGVHGAHIPDERILTEPEPAPLSELSECQNQNQVIENKCIFDPEILTEASDTCQNGASACQNGVPDANGDPSVSDILTVLTDMTEVPACQNEESPNHERNEAPEVSR